MEARNPPQPGAAPKTRVTNKASLLVACVGAGCAALLTPLVSGWESGGRPRLIAYHGKADPPGVWTICDGDTKGVKPGDKDTPAGCALRFDRRLTDHAAPVLGCVPQLRGRNYQLAASISLAYNIGTGAFCASTAAKRFRAGQWRAGCDAFLPWNRANGRVVQGLANRRAAERKLCLTGA
jgi:lysozyme